MTVHKLELKCFEYIKSIQDIEEFQGLGVYKLDKMRKQAHDEICELSGLSKDQTLKYTDHLDKLGWNGTVLYLSLLDEIRKNGLPDPR